MAEINESISNVLNVFETLQHETIHNVIKNTASSKLLTNCALSLLSIVTVALARNKVKLPITNKIRSNIRHIAESIVWKAETTIREIVNDVISKNDIFKDIIHLTEEVERIKQSISKIKGMDVTKEIFDLCEQKMRAIDDKIDDVQKSCERRIKDYDWKIAALASQNLRPIEAHVSVQNQTAEVINDDEMTKNNIVRQARTKLNSKRQL
uniref:NSP4 n=1 Tax=Bovine group B rotavirus TaxID=35334 RepID=A0A1Q2U394_9REOV|nr:NSP4 [Bovine group B rotavirus]BAW98442.1 NSP4 [Bovine group B rotavirus]BAW98443.1 NSP4 [Bovine group B rotavirus]